ncbi:RNA-binding protein [Lactiplantibacillus pentosus]|uniref:DUF3850 domain-containing protein n=1 Tax=Lactiplantibacillus pentosus TaxID=1589 RepID=A0ABD7IUK4_LACPE|nr:DUF3850 domain-containing protein [Lactiplantibacillus pentosus]PRO78103.1 RNA-binding protein [Lactiplantibacillus pentosus]PRO87101.1 RNA-binding protein [Lactiplantibacillus pentosus]RMW51757.1 DUF3850 domain-containing protein [Lactiplantibacillus pentosus]
MVKHREHVLKILPEFYQPVVDHKKPFEIRKNDRNFKVGDYVKLREYAPWLDGYTGNEAVEQITYMTDYHQEPGYVVLGMELMFADTPNPGRV